MAATVYKPRMFGEEMEELVFSSGPIVFLVPNKVSKRISSDAWVPLRVERLINGGCVLTGTQSRRQAACSEGLAMCSKDHLSSRAWIICAGSPNQISTQHARVNFNLSCSRSAASFFMTPGLQNTTFFKFEIVTLFYFKVMFRMDHIF